jgi:hypothetical protein
VTAEKLRGGFYTPPALVRECLRRVRELTGDACNLRVLEPSAGDGAYIRALGEPGWRRRIGRVFALEPMEIEAEKARRALADARLPGDVAATSAIAWAAAADEQYDVAVGNPPFVRYQFVSAADVRSTGDLGDRLGIAFGGVGNLWIPVLLGALSRLRRGGAFAFVVPTECLTGCSARAVRQWLLDECDDLRFDLFATGSFPEVLQEVAILSGRRGRSAGTATHLQIADHGGAGAPRRTHRVTTGGTWTRYLLDPRHLAALDAAQALPQARPLGELVAFEVSTVTGANAFFCVDAATLAEFGLEPWAVPLMARTRHAAGLVASNADGVAALTAGERGWLLDFSADRLDPLRHAGAAAYLRRGEELGLHTRYKCRTREPWYRVPGIVRGELLLSKRSHRWPRVLVNEAGAYTTDTIYRGRLVSDARTRDDVAAAFHCSLTLLTAELEGRSFGGGVLELVPSEVARLTAIVPPGAGTQLRRLDAMARQDPSRVIPETDAYLVRAGALPAEVVPLLDEARRLLARRRLDRNRRPARRRDVAVAAAASG